MISGGGGARNGTAGVKTRDSYPRFRAARAAGQSLFRARRLPPKRYSSSVKINSGATINGRDANLEMCAAAVNLPRCRDVCAHRLVYITAARITHLYSAECLPVLGYTYKRVGHRSCVRGTSEARHTIEFQRYALPDAFSRC